MTNHYSRRTVLAGGAAVGATLALGTGSARAQSYPARPVTLICPWGAGGGTDAIVRPIAFVLTLPITIVTLGLFLFVLNAAMVGLVARLVPGFTISGFWTAMGAAVIVWIVSWVGSSLIGSKGRLERLGK